MERFWLYLSGKIFALTGKMPMKRQDLINIIENKGGSVKSVSKNTSYLVTDDPSSGSGKIKAAEKYGVLVNTFNELSNMLEE